MNSTHKYKIGCGLIILLVAASVFFTYRMCLHTTKRVFTRENTALEKLPEGVPIPLMPDGKRVDYVRAYALVYPDFRADREDNALRDVVRFIGPAIFLWEKYDDRQPDRETGELPPLPVLDEIMERFTEDRAMQSQWHAYCKALALDADTLPPYPGLERAAPPDTEIALRKLAQWQETRADDTDTALPDELRAEMEDEPDVRQAFIRYYSDRFNSPWSAAEFPEMAQWLDSHAELLDIFAAAARQDFFALPFYRDHEQGMLMTMLHSDTQFFRYVARMLTARANLAISDADAARALSDAETILRLGRHLTRQPNTLVPQLVGITLQAMAKKITTAILAANICTPDELASLAGLLGAPSAEAHVPDVIGIDNWSAQEFIDILPADGFHDGDVFIPEGFGLPSGTVDPNYLADRYAALRKAFQQCAATDDYDEIDALADRLVDTPRWKRQIAVLTVRGRSELLAEIVFCLVTPGVPQYSMAKDRSHRGLQLARLAVALKRYKTEHGAYPDTLGALVPAYLPALPVLPNTEKFPLTYYRKDAGFILAAVDSDYDPETGKHKTEPHWETYEVANMPD